MKPAEEVPPFSVVRPSRKKETLGQIRVGILYPHFYEIEGLDVREMVDVGGCVVN